MNIIKKLSPNFSAGRNGLSPQIIVIHIMAGTLTGTDSWFASTQSGVSSHYGIGKNGEIHQYVEELYTAWHAGRVSNPTSKIVQQNLGINPNSFSIGIEHEGQFNDVWTPEMKKSSSELIKDICTRWNIPIDREHIIGHYEIFSGKPNCPAENKHIIDELIAMAQPTPPVVPDKLKSFLDELKALIKKFE